MALPPPSTDEGVAGMQSCRPTRVAPALLIAASFLGASALPAVAQNSNATTPNAPSTYNRNAPVNGAENGPQPAVPSIQQVAQQRLANLHEQLGITANQEAEWGHFSRISLANAARMDNMYRQRAQDVPAMNAVQNLRSWGQIESTEAQDFERVVPAFDNLYQKLTPNQRQTADNLFRDMTEQAEARRQGSRH
jgi:hypothetical protein